MPLRQNLRPGPLFSKRGTLARVSNRCNTVCKADRNGCGRAQRFEGQTDAVGQDQRGVGLLADALASCGPQRVSAVAEASPSPQMPRRSPPHRWTFITNHAQVLLAVAQNPDLRVREIAGAAGITERYAYSILRDLEESGYVDRRRRGRGNVYRIHPDVALGDPLVEEQSIWQLLRLVGPGEGDDVTAMLAHPQPRKRVRARKGMNESSLVALTSRS
jgi:hypothetical protein